MLERAHQPRRVTKGETMLQASLLHYATASHQQLAAADRIREFLAITCSQDVQLSAVRDLLVTCFDSCEFEQAVHWKDGTDDCDWTEIHFEPAASAVKNSHDMRNLATSKGHALGFAIQCLRDANYYIHSVIYEDETYSIRGESALLATISSITFDHVHENHCKRVTNLLEGLRYYGDCTRTALRLRSLPGLASAVSDATGDDERPSEGRSLLATPRAWAKLIRLSVKERLSISLSQGQAQECAAIVFGFQSWNVMVAEAARCTRCFHPQTVQYSNVGRSDDYLGNVKHYRSVAAGIWAFAEANRDHAAKPLHVEYHGTSAQDTGVYMQAIRQPRVKWSDPEPVYVELSPWPIADCSDTDTLTGELILAQLRAEGIFLMDDKRRPTMKPQPEVANK